MGARQKNFYNQIFTKSGYGDAAKAIQDLYLSGDKKGAEAAIPDEYLTENSLIGEEGFVRDRLQALKESGVNALNVGLMGQTSAERVKVCEQLKKLVDTL